MLNILLALAVTSPSHALTCDQHAQLACESEFEFVSRARGPGPQATGKFRPTNDGEGNFLCAAYADVQANGTMLIVHASLDELGNNQRNFQLFVEQNTFYGNVPFTQIDENNIKARIPAVGTPRMIFRGKTEKLANVNITCHYLP